MHGGKQIAHGLTGVPAWHAVVSTEANILFYRSFLTNATGQK
jgi:hypothetical protein